MTTLFNTFIDKEKSSIFNINPWGKISLPVLFFTTHSLQINPLNFYLFVVVIRELKVMTYPNPLALVWTILTGDRILLLMGVQYGVIRNFNFITEGFIANVLVLCTGIIPFLICGIIDYENP